MSFLFNSKGGYVSICLLVQIQIFFGTNGSADDVTLHQQVFLPTNFTLCMNECRFCLIVKAVMSIFVYLYKYKFFFVLMDPRMT